MSKQQKPIWQQQIYTVIRTQSQRRSDIYARIYSEEQRAVINSLIEKGYVPTETIVGKGRCTRTRPAIGRVTVDAQESIGTSNLIPIKNVGKAIG